MLGKCSGVCHKKNWCCSNNVRRPIPLNTVIPTYKMTYFLSINTHPPIFMCVYEEVCMYMYIIYTEM